MRSSLLINLITYEVTPNAFSDEGERKKIRRTIYGNEYGVGFDSSIRARREGLRVSGAVEVYTFEYCGEEDIEINGKIYSILNARVKGDRIILAYGEAIGNASNREVIGNGD